MGDGGWRSLTLVHPAALQLDLLPSKIVNVTCVHGNVCQVLATEVQLDDGSQEWSEMVGIVPDLLVPFLVGADWLGLPKATLESSKPALRVSCPVLPLISLSPQRPVLASPDSPTPRSVGRRQTYPLGQS